MKQVRVHIHGVGYMAGMYKKLANRAACVRHGKQPNGKMSYIDGANIACR